MKKLIVISLLAALARCGFMTPALAQQTTPTALSAPSVKYASGNSFISPAAIQIIGYDSVSSLPCIIGYSATCTLATAGGGGGGGGTSSFFGAAFPASGTALGISDGTNMLALKGDLTNGAWVNVKTSVLPTGAALDATIVTLNGKFGSLGQKTMAGSAPVTIASDQSAVPVSAASLPLPALASTSTKQSDGSQKTQIVDGSGNVIASTSNNLNVQCANCSGSGVSVGDEASFTAGTSLFAPGGGFFQTTATSNALTNGQQGLVQMTANRAFFTNLRNVAGAEVGVAAVPLQVSLANTAANATPVTVTANAGTNLNTSALALETGGNLAQLVTDSGAPGATACATDTASCNFNQLFQRIAQRLTTINTTLGAAPMQATGGTVGLVAGTALVGKVGIDQTTPGTTNGTAIVGVNAATAVAGNGATGTGSLRITIANDNTGIANWGQGATAATAPTGATQAGGRAQNAEATAVTNGQMAGFAADLVGKQIVLPYANPENFVSGVITSAMTGTTSTSLIAAPAGSLRNYITQITCSNSHATVGTDIIIQDGNGGTTFYLLPAAVAYGGAALTLPTPLRQPTAATALYVANVTTGASTKCAASGYKGL